MKAVLISIQPKWCGLIATGKKTIEVRKNRPKIDTPFKCYIYCTKNKSKHDLLELYRWRDGKTEKMNGRVVGEFICDAIFPVQVEFPKPSNNGLNMSEYIKYMCMSNNEIMDYLGRTGKTGYGWHISDLKIYREPINIWEFKKYNKHCFYSDLGLAKPDECGPCSGCNIIDPPQSWCYVEEPTVCMGN